MEPYNKRSYKTKIGSYFLLLCIPANMILILGLWYFEEDIILSHFHLNQRTFLYLGFMMVGLFGYPLNLVTFFGWSATRMREKIKKDVV